MLIQLFKLPPGQSEGVGDNVGVGDSVVVLMAPPQTCGSGPWTTFPEITKFEISNTESSKDPLPWLQSSTGTHPVHWDE